MATSSRWLVLGCVALPLAVGCAAPGPNHCIDPFLLDSAADSMSEVAAEHPQDDTLIPNSDSQAVSRGNNADEFESSTRENRTSSVPIGRRTVSMAALDIGETFRDDAVGVYTEPRNLALLGTALGGAIALRSGPDDDVRTFVAEHPERWGEGSKAIGHLGDAMFQIPVLVGLYTYSAMEGDDELEEFSESAISAYALTGISTLAIKGVTDTDRPTDDWNDGRWSFPSFHSASSFTLAAVTEEHYGTARALPVYALAGLVAWTRLDEQDHELSDVVFGSALGYVIGRSVARRHREGDSRVRIAPWVHPTEGGTGLAWSVDF